MSERFQQSKMLEEHTVLPELLSAKHLQKNYGTSRSMAYQLLNRSDLPVVVIGKRRFMSRIGFDAWITQQMRRG